MNRYFYLVIIILGLILLPIYFVEIVAFLVITSIKLYDIYGAAVVQPTILVAYDFIIVGGGTAGCVLANRLSENPAWQVLLVEAGPEETLLMDIPSFSHFYQFSDVINWQHKTESSENKYCLGMNGNQCKFPRGKVLGGSSTLNYMIYTRGNRKDFDKWAELGNSGWSYKEIEPFFRKLENNKISGDGPLPVSAVNFNTPTGNAFLNAHIELGLKPRDYNGAKQAGVSYVQTTTKNGYRVSANHAYISPIRMRKNLHIRTKTFVTKVLIDPLEKRAIGVELSDDNTRLKVLANKEVIVSAGAIQSPQLLMISGIGPKDHLIQHGIEVMSDLPGVGKNLMDHVSPGAFHFTVNVTTVNKDGIKFKNVYEYIRNGSGVLSIPASCQSIAFLNSLNLTDDYPDTEIVLLSSGIEDYSGLKDLANLRKDVTNTLYRTKNGEPSISMMVFALRPKSRGYIELKSSNPFVHPAIYPNYYSHPYDLETSIRAIEVIHKLEKTKAFQQINATLLKSSAPYCMDNFVYGSKEFWGCHARHLTFTVYHYSGTCKMGPATDRNAVLDERLRIRGISNLRVADGSIMPEITSGHTNAPIFMIGEKAAAMIKEDWQ